MYTIDPQNGDIVISGFDKGIGDSPYSGLADLRNVNITSVPGEAPINFATQSVTQAPALTGQSGSVVTASGGLFVAATALKLEQWQWVTFSNIGTAMGISTNTPYLLFHFDTSGTNERYQLFAAYTGGSAVSITGAGSVTFSTIFPTTPKFFAQARVANFMLDDSGRVWTDWSTRLTAGGGGVVPTNSWSWTKNTLNSGSSGNGLGYVQYSNSTASGDWDGYLYVFSSGQLDFSNVDGVNSGIAYNHVGAYTYGWAPFSTSFVTGGTTENSNYLTGSSLADCPHNALLGPDGRFYFCDYYNLQKFYQTDLITPTTFDPTNTATYTAVIYNLFPINEISTCIAPLGNNYIIGGSHNQAYIWDSTSLQVNQPILLAESYVSQIITVNVNSYLFVGNRGNIYICNGSQADPWVKVPDHLSGTIAPNFSWGGATYQKDHIFFGVYVSNNSGSSLSGYGGVWCIHVPSRAIWESNIVSYGGYGGYISALSGIPPGYSGSSLPTQPSGTGLLIGWNSGNSTYGIDKTISTPYTGGQSYVVSDMIPIGTLLSPVTSQQIEFKLSTPLLTGETIQISSTSSINGSFTAWVNSSGTTATQGDNSLISDIFTPTVQEQQWLLVKCILTGISSNPSYNRLTELRIKGATATQTSYPSLI